MIGADVLVVGDSSFSIAASYVNKGKVISPEKLTCAQTRDINLHPIKGRNAISFEDFLLS